MVALVGHFLFCFHFYFFVFDPDAAVDGAESQVLYADAYLNLL